MADPGEEPNRASHRERNRQHNRHAQQHQHDVAQPDFARVLLLGAH